MALNRKIGIINLNSNEIDIQTVSREWRRKFLGGRGLSAYLLFMHTPPGCDPLGPENTIVIGAGLLAGSLSAPVECAQLMTKSPLTHRLGCAVLSGFFASEMRWAGFDHLVVKGRARRPVYILIHNGTIQIRSAVNIWGKGVFQSRDLIRKELGDENIRQICIGPAGENLVRFANITSERSQISGRTGLGAVLGSKRIKAVVCSGNMDIQIKHPAEILNYQKEFLDKILSADGGSLGQTTSLKKDHPAFRDSLLPDSGKKPDKPYDPGSHLLADLGLDPLTTTSMIRWTQTLYKNKIITDKDTRGLQLGADYSTAAQDILKQITIRKGFGNVLALGPVQAAVKIGVESLKCFNPPSQLISIYTENTINTIPHVLIPKSNRCPDPAEQKFGIDDDGSNPRSASRWLPGSCCLSSFFPESGKRESRQAGSSFFRDVV